MRKPRRAVLLVGAGVILALGAALWTLSGRASHVPVLWSLLRPAPPHGQDDFDLPPPQTRGGARTLWATWYWTPTYPRAASGVPLLDIRERPLGPTLDRESYCSAAVEGAVRVDGQVYTFADTGHVKLTDCTPFWPTMDQAPFVRFRPSSSPFGEGVDGYDLVPYRSLAVDTDRIPTGTLLYIPAARGNPLTLPDGRHVRHDGYFFAADDGYGIDGDHIDVFIGVSNRCPFPWVVSRPDGRFTAYVVADPFLRERLRREHLPP